MKKIFDIINIARSFLDGLHYRKKLSRDLAKYGVPMNGYPIFHNNCQLINKGNDSGLYEELNQIIHDCEFLFFVQHLRVGGADKLKKFHSDIVNENYKAHLFLDSSQNNRLLGFFRLFED